MVFWEDPAFTRRTQREAESLLHDSAETWRREVERDPHQPAAWFELGEVLRELGDVETAGQCYTACVALDPGMAEGWLRLGEVHDDDGRLGEAIFCLTHALAHAPRSAQIRFMLGRCLERAGRVHEARRHFQVCLRLDPQGDFAAIARRCLHG